MMMHLFAVSCLYALLFNSFLVADAAEVAVDALGNVEAGEATTTTALPTEATTARNSTSDRPSPFVELFGERLIYLTPTSDGKSVQPHSISTTAALAGKNVVGVYFSADWCGPCRKFTPDLVAFYKKINKRRRNDFEIVWISRCRAVESHWEFFAHMGWMSIPPEEAMGKRGPALSDRFKVKGIPTLVLLDSDGHVITRDGRNKIPQDKAGIGFPWRNPIATLYLSLVPKSVRTLAKRQLSNVGRRLQAKLGQSLGAMRSKRSAGQTSKAAAAAAA